MYFIPQMETKIMNEGWASYWHYQIMNALKLEQGLHLEFMVRHNQVLAPHQGSLNPYHLGFLIWNDIERRWNEEAGNMAHLPERDASIEDRNQSPGRKENIRSPRN